jgi:hypothetical protein
VQAVWGILSAIAKRDLFFLLGIYASQIGTLSRNLQAAANSPFGLDRKDSTAPSKASTPSDLLINKSVLGGAAADENF